MKEEGVKEVTILQYNQAYGLRSGKRGASKQGELQLSGQRAEKLGGQYLVAIVQGDKIVEWRPVGMYQVRTQAIVEKQSETKLQKWSLQHKKNMVSQFGTSKSKRKLNQMMNNIIE